MLAQATDGGYLCSAGLERDPWLRSLKSEPAFTALVRRIVAAEQDAVRAFVQDGGARALDIADLRAAEP